MDIFFKALVKNPIAVKNIYVCWLYGIFDCNRFNSLIHDIAFDK